MKRMAKRLASTEECGVYELTCRPEDVEQASKEAGLAFFRLDLRRANDKNGFLDAIAATLHFPEWFGRNWDALNDCLTDLDWLSTTTGYVLVFEHVEHFAANQPKDLNVGIEVLRAAGRHWKAERRPFWALLAAPSIELPRWPT